MTKINKLVIIGCAGFGGPGAMMAKKVDPSLDVTLIREEENFLTRCATPYISVERATVEASVKDDGMFHAVGTKLVNVKATSIDRKEKTVTTADGAAYPYDKLLLATGGRAIVPPIPGVDLEGIFTLRTSRDAVDIRDWVNEKKAKNVYNSDSFIRYCSGRYFGRQFPEPATKGGCSLLVVVAQQ